MGINRTGCAGNYYLHLAPRMKKYDVIRAHHILLRGMVINSASVFMKRINCL
jgi:hypothetical protein